MGGVRLAGRLVLLIGLVAAGLAVMSWARSRRSDGSRPSDASDLPRLTYVATAHQLGVVGYRDPVGVISHDGRRVVFSEGRRLFEVPIGGGARVEIAAAEGQIRHVAPGGSSGEWIFEDGASKTRWWTARSDSSIRELFGSLSEIEATAAGDSAATRRRINALRQVVASPDGQWLAAIASGSERSEFWRVAADGSRAELIAVPRPIASPAWSSSREVGCTMNVEGRWRLSMPCGQPPLNLSPDVEVLGPLAFSDTARMVFFASPNAEGFVDLWSAHLDGGHARRETRFARDTYAPSSAAGTVLFKTQSYRTVVAEIDVMTGVSQQLSTLQAETPSYHPDGRTIAVTYGTWRRLIDDAKYPDIAQEIGLIRSMPVGSPPDAPSEVIADSSSEDQAMTWSPNGKWIAFHSHREQSDDIWLRPAAKGGGPDRRVSFLGRGAEVGWPRWSPDGRWVLYDGASPTTGRSVMFVIGIDQDSGEVTAPPREITVSGFEGDMTHAEWLPDSARIVAIAKEAAGRQAILIAPASGGAARTVHRFASEHDFPGLASSPDGRFVAMVAPAADGFFQIFRLPVEGGSPVQLTFDRTNKTQPAWSPDGRRLAFTIWSYDVQFWTLKP